MLFARGLWILKTARCYCLACFHFSYPSSFLSLFLLIIAFYDLICYHFCCKVVHCCENRFMFHILLAQSIRPGCHLRSQKSILAQHSTPKTYWIEGSLNPPDLSGLGRKIQTVFLSLYVCINKRQLGAYLFQPFGSWIRIKVHPIRCI